MRVQRWGLVAAALLAAVALSSCTGPDLVEPPAPTPTITSAVPELPPPGTVIATAELVDANGAAVGSVGIRTTASVHELVVTDYSGPVGADISLRLFVDPVTDIGGCYDTRIGVAAAGLSLDAEQVIPLGDLGRLTPAVGGDPTFLDTVAVVVNTVPSPEFDCLYGVEAMGQLDWDFPDLRPGLLVADSGPRLGAEGDVAVEDGAPVSYTVVDGDVYEAIADRFGIRLDDLRFLNPTRGMTGISTSIVYIGEVLNLGRETR